MPGFLELLIAAALVLGLLVLVMLLANEKTRLVTIVLLALLVPGALVVGGGLFLLFWAEPATYEVQPASVGVDRPAESGLSQRGTAAENVETRSTQTADTADQNAPVAEPEADAGAESSGATAGNASDGGNS